MLSIEKLARGREAYYLATVATGNDHGAGLIEPDGYWLGEGARLLGLEGVALPRDVHRAMAGREPASGRSLVSSSVRVAAFDCCFSTPKSLSVLFALGSDEVTDEIQAGHNAAVEAALGYLEREAACAVVLGTGGEVAPAAGVVACAFPHRLSRAPDPHLHTHLLIANLVPVGDQAWRPLDARGIYGEARTTGALYETHLRHELTHRLGVTWGPLRGAWADIAGIDRSAIVAFSRRSTEIEAGLAASGLTGPGTARMVANDTRPPKRLDQPYEELVETWRVRSWELGVSGSFLASLTPGPSDREPVLQGRWEDGTLRLLEQASPDGSFTRRQAVVARCESAPVGLSVAEVERDVDGLLGGDRVIASGVRHAGALSGRRAEPVFTTPAAIARNDRVAAMVTERADYVTVLAYESGGRLDALDDLAAAACAWAASGHEVAALAPGRRAVAAFEAATAIEAVAGTALPPGSAQPSVLVVADAHRLVPAELESLLADAAERGSALTLLAPASAVAAHPTLEAIGHEAAGRLPADRQLDRPPGAPIHYSFGGTEVTVVASAEAARQHAVQAATELATARHAPVALVAGDESVVMSLRAMLGPEAALAGVQVTHARALDEMLAPSGGRGTVVCVGGAAVLQRGAAALARLDRIHIVLSPEAARTAPDRSTLALAAEAARPLYLTAELGAAPSGLAERAAWRRGAVVIEGHRSNFGIEDARRAFGGRQAAEPVARAEDRARTRAEVVAIVRGLDRERAQGLGRER